MSGERQAPPGAENYIAPTDLSPHSRPNEQKEGSPNLGEVQREFLLGMGNFKVETTKRDLIGSDIEELQQRLAELNRLKEASEQKIAALKIELTKTGAILDQNGLLPNSSDQAILKRKASEFAAKELSEDTELASALGVKGLKISFEGDEEFRVDRFI